MVKTKKQEKYFYPTTPETMHQYVASIFGPIKRGECVTTIWVPMAGRRMWNKFIIENIELFKEELPDYQRYLLVYIEPLDLAEESLEGYLRLMVKSLTDVCQKQKGCKRAVDFETKIGVFDDEKTPYSRLLGDLKLLIKEITEVGLEVVFFLGEFDEIKHFAKKVFYNNLKSLWDTFRPRLHYIFFSIEDLTTPEATDRLGELNAATLQNVVYVPIRQDDIDYFIDFFGERLNYQFSEEARGLIKKLCGGHPYLIKAATRIISNFVEEKTRIEDLRAILTTHYEMLSVARRIFNLRTEKEKDILNKIAAERKIQSSGGLKRLLRLGLVRENKDGTYGLAGQLFNLVAKKYKEAVGIAPGKEKEGLYLNEGAGVVCYGGVSVEEKFTRQEYDVIKSFLEQPGKLISRDEISQILWGEESYEKYSNWAIDQLMSKLRKKLKRLGAKTKLVTVRGRGYKLVS